MSEKEKSSDIEQNLDTHRKFFEEKETERKVVESADPDQDNRAPAPLGLKMQQ